MEQRSLGATGVQVSALGFGCGAFAGLLVRGERHQQIEAVRSAVDGGITYFDTAAQYGDGVSETKLGDSLAAIGATNDVVIGTKVRFATEDLDNPGPAMRASLQESMARLQRDVIDVYVLHNFPRSSTDRNGVLTSHLSLIASEMRALQREGLVRSIGLTGVGETAAIIEAVESGLFDFIQCYFNVLNPSAINGGAAGGGQDFEGVGALAVQRGQSVMGVRTMAGGALVANDYRSDIAGPVGNGGGLGGSPYAADLERAKKLIPVAEAAGCEDVVEFGLRFAISEPRVATALVGFSDVEQVETALRAAERGALAPSAVVGALAMARQAVGFK